VPSPNPAHSSICLTSNLSITPDTFTSSQSVCEGY
jgi:hypothetical protein